MANSLGNMSVFYNKFTHQEPGDILVAHHDCAINDIQVIQGEIEKMQHEGQTSNCFGLGSTTTQGLRTSTFQGLSQAMGGLPGTNFTNLFPTDGGSVTASGVEQIWDKLSELEQKFSSNQRNLSSVSWGLASTGAVPHSIPLEELKVKVNRINTELDDMQVEMNDSAIEISGGIKFALQSKTRAWFATHTGTKHKGKHDRLVNLKALLNISKGGSKSINSNVKFEVDLNRAGYTTLDEACYFKSFGLELPAQFGTSKELSSD